MCWKSIDEVIADFIAEGFLTQQEMDDIRIDVVRDLYYPNANNNNPQIEYIQFDDFPST